MESDWSIIKGKTTLIYTLFKFYITVLLSIFHEQSKDLSKSSLHNICYNKMC